MLPYSPVPAGCNHRIQMMLKVQCSQLQYTAFTRAICFLVTDSQCTCLEWVSIYLSIYIISQPSSMKLTFCSQMLPRSSDSLTLWNTRCNPPFVIFIMLSWASFHLLQIHSLHRTICSLSFRIDSLHEFPLHNLQRLKDKMAWLSDTHIDFSLQCVLFLHVIINCVSESDRDFFHQPLAKQPPPSQNLLLLPCWFWTQLSQYQRSLQPNINPGPIYWNMILSSCLCMGGSCTD